MDSVPYVDIDFPILSVYAFQVAGFFVRRVLLQDKEYSYGRSFDKNSTFVCLLLHLPSFAFLVGLVKSLHLWLL